MPRFAPLLLLSTLLTYTACGPATPPPGPSVSPAATQCTSRQVQIGISDGFLQHFCGCSNLTAGQFIHAGTSLNCTGPVGVSASNAVVVFFHYNPIAAGLHLIAPTTPGAFIPSPPYNPKDVVPFRAFGVRFTATGAYGFRDMYTSSLNGVINL